MNNLSWFSSLLQIIFSFRRYCIVIFFSIFAINISSAQVNTKTEAKVNLEIDYKNIEIKDEFDIFFVVGNDTIRPEIKADKIIFDNSLIKDSSFLILVFKYKKYCLSFPKTSTTYIKNNKNYKFWFDKKPFSKEHTWGVNKLKTKYLYGWDTSGDGCGGFCRIAVEYKIFHIF